MKTESYILVKDEKEAVEKLNSIYPIFKEIKQNGKLEIKSVKQFNS